MIAMTYGNVYVAHVAFGAKDAQTVKAFLEAEAYAGPSLIIAYSHCIAHGYDLAHGLEQQKLAVDSGYWPLYRFDPRRAGRRREPAACSTRRRRRRTSRKFMRNETRFRMVEQQNPERFKTLLASAQQEVAVALRALRADGEDDHGQRQTTGRPSNGGYDGPVDHTISAFACRTRSCRAPRRWPIARHRQAARGRGRRRDRDALAVRGADHARARRASCTTWRCTTDSFAEALSYFPKPDEFALGPDEYLEQIRRIKAGGEGPGDRLAQRHARNAGWLSYAAQMEQAGADALELNVYYVATDPKRDRGRGRGDGASRSSRR